MGLFRGNTESDEERFERYKQEIIDAEYLIRLELATGTHGADEIIAGSMIGETGKLIAMSKYGDTIWTDTTIQLYNESFQVHYNGSIVGYDTIIGFDRGKKSWGKMEFLIHTTNGNWLFRSESVFAEAVMAVINALKEYYLNNLEEEKENSENNDGESNIGKIIQLGEMYENGLLSKEEYISMKNELLDAHEKNNSSDNSLNQADSTEETATDNNKRNSNKYCRNCGAKILKDSNFCMECGNPLK